MKKLEDEDWFHGVLPREEVQRLLAKDGDFLVRESKNKRTNDTQYVLSAYWQGYRHFIIQFTEVSYHLSFTEILHSYKQDHSLFISHN